MKIYIDNDFKCHVSNDGTMREIETPFFDGKCNEFIEGFRYVPSGEVWVSEDGKSHSGMISAWQPFRELEKAQLEYELAQAKAELADADDALAELGVTVDG